MNFPETDLPLFPLSTVLFPQMPMPLRVFEPRYHDLVARCLQEDIGFGVALIKSGEEVGGTAEPFNVGTVARIVKVDQQQDNSIDLVAVGVFRFRLLNTSTSHSYLSGDIERWADEMGEPGPLDRLLPIAHKSYIEYATALLELMGAQVPGGGQVEAPMDPQVLSYLIAANLQVSTEEKQSLLEAISVQARLETELELLAREKEAMLKAKSLRSTLPPDIEGFSKN